MSLLEFRYMVNATKATRKKMYGNIVASQLELFSIKSHKIGERRKERDDLGKKEERKNRLRKMTRMKKMQESIASKSKN